MWFKQRAEGPQTPEAARPERAEAPSPGQRPVRAKALKYQAINKAFALTGRQVCVHNTQGAALG